MASVVVVPVLLPLPLLAVVLLLLDRNVRFDGPVEDDFNAAVDSR